MLSWLREALREYFDAAIQWKIDLRKQRRWREKNHKMGMSTCTTVRKEFERRGGVARLERNSLLTGALNEPAIKAAVKGIRGETREREDNLLSIRAESPNAGNRSLYV